MRRVTPRVWVAVLPGVSLGAVLFAQAALSGQGFGVTQRDGPPPPPAVRRIPIGTSTIRVRSRRLTRGNPSAVRASPWVEPLGRPVPLEARRLAARPALLLAGARPWRLSGPAASPPWDAVECRLPSPPASVAPASRERP